MCCLGRVSWHLLCRLQVDLSDQSDWNGALELYHQAAEVLRGQSSEAGVPDVNMAVALHVS